MGGERLYRQSFFHKEKYSTQVEEGKTMKTSNLLRSLCLSIAGGALLASCGGSGGEQKIPGGRNNFSIELSSILSPDHQEEGICLQPDVEIFLPTRAACSDLSNLHKSVYVVKKGAIDPRPVTMAPAYHLRDEGQGCVAAVPTAGFLAANTDYFVSTAVSSSGSVLIDSKHANLFTTGSYQENFGCGNAFSFRDTPESDDWQKTSLLQMGKVRPDGSSDFDLSDLTDIAQNLGMEFLQAAIGFSSLPPSASLLAPLTDQPDSFLMNNRIRIFKANELSDFLEQGAVDEISFEDCDTPTGSCYEIVEDTQGEWNIVIHQDNQGFQPGNVYMVFVVESLKNVRGRFLDATYLTIIVQ